LGEKKEFGTRNESSKKKEKFFLESCRKITRICLNIVFLKVFGTLPILGKGTFIKKKQK
jgi:hypothetical protein